MSSFTLPYALMLYLGLSRELFVFYKSELQYSVSLPLFETCFFESLAIGHMQSMICHKIQIINDLSPVIGDR